jgi:hypothetical protein
MPPPVDGVATVPVLVAVATPIGSLPGVLVSKLLGVVLAANTLVVTLPMVAKEVIVVADVGDIGLTTVANAGASTVVNGVLLVAPPTCDASGDNTISGDATNAITGASAVLVVNGVELGSMTDGKLCAVNVPPDGCVSELPAASVISVAFFTFNDSVPLPLIFEMLTVQV